MGWMWRLLHHYRAAMRTMKTNLDYESRRQWKSKQFIKVEVLLPTKH